MHPGTEPVPLAGGDAWAVDPVRRRRDTPTCSVGLAGPSHTPPARQQPARPSNMARRSLRPPDVRCRSNHRHRSGCPRQHRLGPRAPRRPEGPLPRGRRRHRCLRHRPPAGRDRHQLEEPADRSGQAGPRQPRRAAVAAARRRRRRRHHDRAVRRQQQLVRRLGLLAAPLPGPRQRPPARRRPDQGRGRWASH